MARPPLSLKAKALALVAQREHSRIELRRKLLAHLAGQARRAAATPGPAPAGPVDAEAAAAEVDALLDWLAAHDLLNAARFTEARVHARAARFGTLRIRHELAQHGLELDAETAQRLRGSEMERARGVWSKRFGSVAADAAGRARQMRFLAARGFSADVVRQVVAGTAPDS